MEIWKNKGIAMSGKVFRNLIVFEILIIILVAIGVVIPKSINCKNVTTSQILFILIIINTFTYIFFHIINKKNYNLISIMENMNKNILKDENKNKEFNKMNFDFERLYSKSESFLGNFGEYMKKQNKLLQDYLTLNRELEKNNNVRDILLEISHSVIKIKDIDDFFY